MSVCDTCKKRPATVTGVINSKFGHYCAECATGDLRLANTGAATWHRQRDYEDHREDLIQPYDNNGKPNGEFIRSYPEESAEIFTDEQIERYSL